MKKRLEDRLIELAFEDRTGSGSAPFAGTPEAAARLKEYRVMRSALGQLRELPEHQLSTERLREALLHQGLKRRRAFPWQALGYGSAAVGLFVCAYFVSRDVRRAVAPGPKLNLTEKDLDRSDIQLPNFVFNSNDASTNIASTSPKSATTLAHRDTPRSHEVGIGNIADATKVGPTIRLADFRGAVVAPVGDTSKGNPTGTAPTNGGVREPGSAGNGNKLPLSNAMVLIQSQTDENTGLDTAKEVTASGDVLVGG